MKDELEMRNPLSEDDFNKVVDEDIECVKAVTFSTKKGKKRFVPEPEWIPVTKKIPERDEEVLAWCKCTCFEYIKILWIDELSGLWSDGDNFHDEVLAWMPLPEPYQGENE